MSKPVQLSVLLSTFAIILVTTSLAVAAPTPKGKGKRAAVVRVDTVVRNALVETVSIVGRLVARQSGTLASNVSGPVTEVRAQVGDHVAHNQIVAVLDKARLSNTRDLARAKLSLAKAALLTSHEQLALAKQERKRLEKLRPSAATSEALFDTAIRKEAIEHARIAESEAALQIADSELQLAELNLSYTSIRAPYEAVVIERLIEIGSYVQIGQPIARLISDKSVEIEAEIPYTRLQGLAKGVEIRVRLDDSSIHSARVRAVLPLENLLTRTRVVRLVPTFGTTTNPLATGQSISLDIPSGSADTVLSVHKDAITRKGEKNLVYVVEQGKAILKFIQTGRAVGNRIEVISGLTEGDITVVRGNERLRPNDSVRVAEKP